MPKKSSKRKKINIRLFLLRTVYSISVVAIVFALSNMAVKSYDKFVCSNEKTCNSDLSLHIDNNSIGYFEGKKVYPPKISQTSEELSHSVLGESIAPGEKHIFVDLSKQILTAYQGTTLIMKTLVATGKWHDTPVGNFYIWEKLISTRMAGGEGADAYDLPNVPYVMYFHNDFGVHGAYWHDNFGHKMSHGCVNMRQVDAKALFQWADGPSGNTKGTEVSVCDQITQSGQCIQNNPIQ